MVGTEFGTQDFEANTELRHSVFSLAEHTPETNLTGHHQVFRGGKQVCKFILEIELMFFGSPESRQTIGAGFVECFKVAFGWIDLPRRKMQVVLKQLPHHRIQNDFMQSLPIFLHELPDSPTLMLFSENVQKDVDIHRHMIR